MTADRDTTRVVRSWLRTDEHESADRVLATVLSRLDATPQRRSMWPSRRFALMNRLVLAATAAAAVLVVAVVGYNLLPRASGPGGPTFAPTFPSATPVPLAVGSFLSHGGQIELHATGDGQNVKGTMTYADPANAADRFAVDLACTRVTAGGLILIGGTVTDSAYDSEPKGSRVSIVLQRGTPVKALIHSEYPDPAFASCKAFLESIPDVGDAAFMSVLEPIQGTITLRQ
jgi:hypothetical protein